MRFKQAVVLAAVIFAVPSAAWLLAGEPRKEGAQWISSETPLVAIPGHFRQDPVLTNSSFDRTLIFIVVDEKHEAVMVDGLQGKPYDPALGGSGFSPDGRRFAYVMSRNGPGCVAVVDGRELFRHHAVLTPLCGIGFSPDSQHVVYSSSRSDWEDWKERCSVIVDGKPSPWRRGCMPYFIFSPDSRRSAYVVFNVTDKTYQVMLDGQESRRYNGVPEDSLCFSPDSKRFAHTAPQAGGESFVVIDGKESPPCEAAGPSGGPRFSPDSRHVAYWAKRTGKCRIILDDKEVQAFDEVWDGPFFTSGGGQWVTGGANSSGQDWTTSVVLGGKTVQTISGHGRKPLCVSADGAHTAFALERGGKVRVVVDGKEGREYEGLVNELLCLSPDGSRVAYVARRGEKGVVVVDDREVGEYDEVVQLSFSPDGKHWACAFRKGTGWGLAVDGSETNLYRGFLRNTPAAGIRLHREDLPPALQQSLFGFDGSDKVRAVAIKYEQVMRVNMRLVDLGVWPDKEPPIAAPRPPPAPVNVADENEIVLVGWQSNPAALSMHDSVKMPVFMCDNVRQAPFVADPTWPEMTVMKFEITEAQPNGTMVSGIRLSQFTDALDLSAFVEKGALEFSVKGDVTGPGLEFGAVVWDGKTHKELPAVPMSKYGKMTKEWTRIQIPIKDLLGDTKFRTSNLCLRTRPGTTKAFFFVTDMKIVKVQSPPEAPAREKKG